MLTEKHYLPNYKDGSSLNLVSSIAKSFNVKTNYNPLKNLEPELLKKYKNIVLIVVDGLGYDYLIKNGKDSFLCKNLNSKITSVFPSATSTAIPSFFTGASCLEHEMTSWYSFIKELGEVIIPLPFTTRIKPRQPIGKTAKIKDLFTLNPITKKIKEKTYIVTLHDIYKSDFSRATAGKAELVGYKNIKGGFKKIRNIIKINKRKYIFSYFSEHDSLCHKYGIENKKVSNNFRRFDKELRKFIESLKGTDTLVIISSDHGCIDVPENKKIKIKEHPILADSLAVPICGDNRYAYCFVRASKKKQFENYVRTKLKYCCKMYKSEDLIKRGFFGLEKPSKRFIERIGDYVLIMKENYGIYEKLKKEKENYHVAEHGGLSKQEMLVPLVLIDTNKIQEKI